MTMKRQDYWFRHTVQYAENNKKVMNYRSADVYGPGAELPSFPPSPPRARASLTTCLGSLKAAA